MTTCSPGPSVAHTGPKAAGGPCLWGAGWGNGEYLPRSKEGASVTACYPHLPNSRQLPSLLPSLASPASRGLQALLTQIHGVLPEFCMFSWSRVSGSCLRGHISCQEPLGLPGITIASPTVAKSSKPFPRPPSCFSEDGALRERAAGQLLPTVLCLALPTRSIRFRSQQRTLPQEHLVCATSLSNARHCASPSDTSL